MDNAEVVHDVLVVGAGISGLSAAKLLHENGQDVLVLEARNRVGGRLYTYKDPSVQYCDLGGAYVGPTQNRIFRLSSELGVKTYKLDPNGDVVFMTSGFRRVFGGMAPKTYNPFVIFDMNNLARTIDKLAETERKFIGGSQQICEKIVDVIGKDKVVYESPVIKIEQNDSVVTVGTADGSLYKARYVISALAPALLGRIAFSPPLSPLKTQLIQRFPMGSVIKTIVYYKTSFWREKGLCGTIATDKYAVTAFDDTKPDGSHPAIMGFVNGKYARELTLLTKDERKRRLCKLYAQVFESDEALNPVNYIDQNWLAEEFSGGCYVGVAPPGVLTNFGSALRESHGNVYFAGTETATDWVGYMDGGIQAGERAAREILYVRGMISEEEIWQEEPEFPDAPVVPLIATKWEKYLPSVPGFLKFMTFSAVVLAGAVILVKNPQIACALKDAVGTLALAS